MISNVSFTSLGKLVSKFQGFNEITKSTYDNVSIVALLVCVLLIALTLFSDKNRIKLLFRLLFSYTSSAQNDKEKISFSKKETILLFFNYVIVLGILLVEIINRNDEYYPFLLLLELCGALLGLFIIKRVFMLFSGFLFDIKNEIHDYLIDYSLFILIAGVLLVPLVVFLLYSGVNQTMFSTYFSIFIGLFLSMRVGKTLFVSIKHKVVRSYYLILYICTLEILPLAISWKVFFFPK